MAHDESQDEEGMGIEEDGTVLGAGASANADDFFRYGMVTQLTEAVDSRFYMTVWANYYWATITRFKRVLKVFNRTLR